MDVHEPKKFERLLSVWIRTIWITVTDMSSVKSLRMANLLLPLHLQLQQHWRGKEKSYLYLSFKNEPALITATYMMT